MSENTRVTEHQIAPQFTQRWSPRSFTGEAIAEAELLGFIEAARWAPSAYNVQPWRFVYALRDTPEWTPIFESLLEFNQGWAKRASALVVVASRTTFVPPGSTESKPNGWHAFDAGAAWGSFAHQATLAGWFTHAMAGFDAAKLAVAIGLPEGFAAHAVIAVGKRGDKAQLPEGLQGREAPSGRLALAEVAVKGRFGG
ncbi:nitroreductase family protein [Derxia gummosa]|uniref:Nitroreductase family protein n=1 Tax=Derxia gummosa DSM 723 TaxID=1121388 RepID=A0A8B6X448_9BURK|nr:nitroreductase family protein [Derxia gummosa]